MTTYPLSFPALGVQGIVIRRGNAGGMTSSPYTGSQEVYRYPGQWWGADVTFRPANLQQAGKIEAFLNLLEGTYGTFLMGDPMRPVPLGGASSSPGTPLVNGAQSKRANVLNIKGGAHSITGWLLAGDYIQLGSGLSTHLHQVCADANTDSGGNAALILWPRLRADVADGDTVVVSGCKGLFRLPQATQAVTRRPGPFTDCNITVVEAL